MGAGQPSVLGEAGRAGGGNGVADRAACGGPPSAGRATQEHSDQAGVLEPNGNTDIMSYGAYLMRKLFQMAAAAALVASGATLAVAQTTPPTKSKSEAGAPQQGPGKAEPNAATGTGAGTGGTTTTPAPGTPPNPTGMSKEKQKSEANDPQQGGKKQ